MGQRTGSRFRPVSGSRVQRRGSGHHRRGPHARDARPRRRRRLLAAGSPDDLRGCSRPRRDEPLPPPAREHPGAGSLGDDRIETKPPSRPSDSCGAPSPEWPSTSPSSGAELEVSTDVLVVGGRPAGLAAALTLAEAGRQVTVVEKSPILGGLPVRIEDLFPKLECGPCVLEPFLAEALTGPHRLDASRSSCSSEVRARSRGPSATSRSASAALRGTSASGPASAAHSASRPARPPCRTRSTSAAASARPWTSSSLAACRTFRTSRRPNACASRGRTAPSAPRPAPWRTRSSSTNARRCSSGAWAPSWWPWGASPTSKAHSAHLGAGLSDVLTSLEVERLLASNGPTRGQVLCVDGAPPARVAFVHCAGSLDPRTATTARASAASRPSSSAPSSPNGHPEAAITHYVRSIVAPGKEAASLVAQVTDRGLTRFVTYGSRRRAHRGGHGGRIAGGLHRRGRGAIRPRRPPSRSRSRAGHSQPSSKVLGVDTDSARVLRRAARHRPRHASQPARRPRRGLVPRAREPWPRPMTEGAAAAGQILAGLVPGRQGSSSRPCTPPSSRTAARAAERASASAPTSPSATDDGRPQAPRWTPRSASAAAPASPPAPRAP